MKKTILLLNVLMLSACLLAPSIRAQNVPTIPLAQGPLYGAVSRVHPNMLLALSVEFPTTGIAYTDPKYDRSQTYIGYFDDRMCYSYLGDSATKGKAEVGYFYPDKAADANHECLNSGGGRFSGNFMNWVSSSAIDMLRYAMTGGDRIVDTAATTILQRAYLRESFYDSGNFPARVIQQEQNTSAPKAVTPFNDSSIVVVSCRNLIYFGKNNQNNRVCDNPGKNGDYGRFLARVQVCDLAEGPTRPDLCAKYGAIYKPVGEMQKNANRIRFGAFGYLMDDNIGRYGGVLRAPMKYLGEKTYDTNFASSNNLKQEWDPTTGIFVENPEKASEGNSGVVNYLNKFGRTGASLGRYKTYDPVSELYYEAIRYYKGLQPTDAATAGMTTEMKDGFQVVKPWDDPILAACQKNYIISIADANTHCDKTLPGNSRGNGTNCDSSRAAGSDGDSVDYTLWTNKVGDFEKRANLSSVSTGATDASYYIAGMAYWANTQDIRADLDGKQTVRTFSVDVDEYGNGDINKAKTRQLYYAGKYGGFKDTNGDGNPFVTTNPANPADTNFSSNLEWEDAPGSGIPRSYFLACQPIKMINNIRTIFSQINAETGTSAPLGITSLKLYAGESNLYQPGFDAARWSGTLKSYKVSLDANSNLQIASTPKWDAGVLLTGTPALPAPSPAARNIITLRGDGKPADFKWGAIDTDMQDLLDTDPVSKQKDKLGSDRLDYLRGVRTKEQQNANGIFRSRDSVLGDIINSGVTYVGAPTQSIGGDDYNAFYEANKSRVKAIYAGSNDGMLHAFNGMTGDELFAYVPNALFGELSRLTDPDYVHRPYVDATPIAAEAQVGGKWKTVLVSPFGGGAQGAFAINVTNPAAVTSDSVLWEFTDKDDKDMGNVLGQPQIAKFRVGTNQYKWYAIVASGFNNNLDDGKYKNNDRFNPAAPGALFLLSLDKAPGDAWVEGSNYRKFVVPATDTNLPNALSTPAVVTGVNDDVIVVYAGDLQENLWKFDFANPTPFKSVLPSTPKPLFTAKLSNGKVQPITVQPRVAFAPGTGYIVMFGTGKFVQSADTDPAQFMTQSFYAVYDNGYNLIPKGRSSLQVRTLKSGGNGMLSISGDPFVLGSKTGQKFGWYVDYLNSATTGERSATPAAVGFGQVFFNSLITGVDACSTGTGRSYGVDLLTGLPVTSGDLVGKLSQIGILGMPNLFVTSNSSGDFTATRARTNTKKYAVVNYGTGGAAGNNALEKTGSVGDRGAVFSWREVVNFQTLQEKAK